MTAVGGRLRGCSLGYERHNERRIRCLCDLLATWVIIIDPIRVWKMPYRTHYVQLQNVTTEDATLH